MKLSCDAQISLGSAWRHFLRVVQALSEIKKNLVDFCQPMSVDTVQISINELRTDEIMEIAGTHLKVRKQIFTSNIFLHLT